MPKERKVFEFGLFRLDVRERRLAQDGHAVALHGKVFDTLHVLVANHGRLVTKDELMAAVWADSVVEETNLNHNICILRRALGEKATGQKYIETVPRQGYRFAAEVKELDEPEPSATLQPPDLPQVEQVLAETGPMPPAPPCIDSRLQPDLPNPEGKTTPDGSPRRFHSRAVVMLLLAAGLLAIVYIEVQRFRHAGRTSSPRTMLAVLPFENLTGNPGEEYISAGFNQEIISQLGRWNPARLGVIARTSSNAYRETRKSVSEIGRELGVNFIVEGSVRRDGSRIRITVALVRVNDQVHLWSANYDGSVDDVLSLQVEVTRDIIQEITGRIAAEPAIESDLTAGRLFQNSRIPAIFNPELQTACFL